jgi:predicted metal-dependent HD superfamily phosphohydrolase
MYAAIASTKFHSLLAPFGVNPVISQEIFTDIASAYSSADRHYHNLTHILQVLQIIDEMRLPAENPAALEFAAWFHDIIYDPKAKDNEEKSAEYATNILRIIKIPSSTIDKVAKIILATKTHQAPDNDIDTYIFLDADLSILGASSFEYHIYDRAIRKEYSWLSEEEYRLGRIQVLQKFIQRERIYLTAQIFETREIKARQNIQTEIESLSAVNIKKM